MTHADTAGPYRLQELLFPMAGRPGALYLSGTPAPQPSGSGWSCDAGAALSFDSFFNSLYPAFWHRNTGVRRFGLCLRGEGRVRLTLVHSRKGRHGKTLVDRTLDLATGAGATVWLPDVPDQGRVHAHLACQTRCRIDGLAFVTDRPPVRDVRLSLGLCTFNREARLADTIRAIARARPDLPALTDLVVVNQGEPFSDARLLGDLDKLGAQVHRQPNLGGSGGFSRTLHEALQAPSGPTHHLLMDDDILLDARVIGRLTDALGHTEPEVLLGGSMLETERPTLLYEAGARVLPKWDIDRIGEGLDMSEPGSTALFERAYRVDYNGWWFCAVPLSAVRLNGLPLPIFIHGDDIEYGCRMQAAGVRTAIHPGIAVWHDAFTGKPRPWIVYYDFRNLLINGALYPGVAEPIRPIDVLGALFARLLCHQYDMARALMQGVTDYLSGPGRVLGADLPGIQARLTAGPSLDDQQAAAVSTLAPAPVAGPKRPLPPGIWPVIALFVWRFVRISLPRRPARPLRVFAPHAVHPGVAGPGAYALATDPAGERVTILHPRRVRLWLGAVRALSVAVLFLLRHRRAARDWSEHAREHATAEMWQRHFLGDGR